MRPNDDEADLIHAMMRKLYPCGVVDGDGEVLGAWFVTSAETRPHPEGKGIAADVDVLGFVRTRGGVVGLKERFPLKGSLRSAVEARLSAIAATNDPSALGKAHQDFCEAIRVAAWQVDFDGVRDGREAEGLAMSITGTLNFLQPGRLDQSLLRECVEERMGTVSGRLEKALGAFDPDAVATLMEVTGHDLEVAGAWAGLDRSFDPDAPLAEAFDTMPGRVPELVAAWHADPAGLADAVANGSLKAHLRGRRTMPVGVAATRAASMPVVARALDAVDDAFLDEAFGKGASADRVGCAEAAMSLLDGYGPEADPKGEKDWLALAMVAPLLTRIGTWAGTPGAKCDLVPMPQGPSAALRELLKASNEGSVITLLDDMDAVAMAFARQVAQPAAAVSGMAASLPPSTDGFWLRVSRDALFSGRPMLRNLEAVRRWRSSNGDLAVALAAMDARTRQALSWPPGIPDGRMGDLSIVVAKSDDDLRRLADMSVGLGFDATSSARACLAGTRRVVSVEGPVEGGTRRLLSCHLLGMSPDGVLVIDGRGRNGAPVPEECSLAVGKYASAVGPAYRDAISAVMAAGATEAAARVPYDVTASTWSEARIAWCSHVCSRPAYASAARLTAVAMAHAEGLRTAWSAKAFDRGDPTLKGTRTGAFLAESDAAELARLGKETASSPNSAAAKRVAVMDNPPEGWAAEKLARAFEDSPFLRRRGPRTPQATARETGPGLPSPASP